MTGLQGLRIRFAYLCVQYVKMAKKDHYLYNLLYCNENWVIDLEISPLYYKCEVQRQNKSISRTEPIGLYFGGYTLLLTQCNS